MERKMPGRAHTKLSTEVKIWGGGEKIKGFAFDSIYF